MRGSGPTRGGIANAVGTNEYQTNAADLDPGSLRASGCSGVADVSRCVELALNVAIDENSVTRHALAIFATEEVQPPVRPLAVPYDSLFAAGPAAIDTEKRPGIQRRITSGGTTRLLFDALALPLRTHSEVLATLRSSNPAWAALNDAQLLARRPIIHIELNGLVLGNVAPPPLCNADINRACSLRVFERPGGAIDQCPFDQSGLCATPLRSRGAYGGLATEFVYAAGAASPPAFGHWDLRAPAVGDQVANGGLLEQTLCVDGLTHPTLCVQGLVWSYPPHERISGHFVDIPARIGMVAQTARGWGYTLEGVAAVLNATTMTLVGDTDFLERPLADSFAYTPADAINGFDRGMAVFRLESVTREALREVGARRFDLSAVTQGEFGDIQRRHPSDINAFQFSPVSFEGASVVAHSRTNPNPIVSVRVHPEALPMITEMRISNGDRTWTATRVAGNLGLFRAQLSGIAVLGYGDKVRVDALSNANAVQGLVGFDMIPLVVHTDNDDSDFDGVIDRVDNCPGRSNTPQADIDRDGQGDHCDDDMDGDGVSNESEMSNGTDPRAVDSDGDGLNDRVENGLGFNPRIRDSDGDGVLDGQESANADDDCDGLPNSRDNLNNRIGQTSTAAFFKGIRNSTFELTVIESDQPPGQQEPAMIAHHVTATVSGATWWLPAENASAITEGLGLELQPGDLTAPAGFLFRPYFVAARPVEYLGGARDEDLTISALTVRWSTSGPATWGSDANRRRIGVVPKWVIRGCPDDQAVGFTVLTNAVLRNPRYQRCIANALRGTAGFVGTQQSQGQNLCGAGNSAYAQMLKINDWNGVARGLTTPGIPRIVLCRFQQNAPESACDVLPAFAHEGCEGPNVDDCGAGITLTSIAKAFAQETIRGLNLTVPSMNTSVSRDNNSIWTPDERTVFSKPAPGGGWDPFNLQSTAGTTIPPTAEGNWITAQRVALHIASSSTETWYPQFNSVSLRPPGVRTDPPPDREAVLWISELDGLRGGGVQNAQIVLRSTDVPGAAGREIPFRISIVEPEPTTLDTRPYESSPSIQVCRRGRELNPSTYTPSPGGRPRAGGRASELISGLLRPGRTTLIDWNGRLGCGAGFSRDPANPDLYHVNSLRDDNGPVQRIVAPLRPGQYRMLVEFASPCREPGRPVTLRPRNCQAAGANPHNTVFIPNFCWANQRDGNLITSRIEMTFTVGMEVNFDTVAGIIVDRSPLSPSTNWFDLGNEAAASALRVALVARANQVIAAYGPRDLALRFIGLTNGPRSWWLPTTYASPDRNNRAYCPQGSGRVSPDQIGIATGNRWFADSALAATRSGEVFGCVDFNRATPTENNALRAVIDFQTCARGRCPAMLVGAPAPPPSRMTRAQKVTFLTQVFGFPMVHEALHDLSAPHTSDNPDNYLTQFPDDIFAEETDRAILDDGWARGRPGTRDTRELTYFNDVTAAYWTTIAGPRAAFRPGVVASIAPPLLVNNAAATHWIMGPQQSLPALRNFTVRTQGAFDPTLATMELDDRVGLSDILGPNTTFLSTLEKMIQLFRTRPLNPHAIAADRAPTRCPN